MGEKGMDRLLGGCAVLLGVLVLYVGIDLLIGETDQPEGDEPLEGD